MDKVIIPASITIEKGLRTKRYRWKSNKKKESLYKRQCRRAAIRFTCKNFAVRINKLKKENRQIAINFLDDSNVSIRRTKNKDISLQGYSGEHPYVQLIVNRALLKKSGIVLISWVRKLGLFRLKLKSI